MTTIHALTGPELKAIRRKAGVSQSEMAKLVGCSRHNVSYHETKRRPFRLREYRWGCLARMLDVLGVEILPNFAAISRARGDGVLFGRDRKQEWLDRQFARINTRETAKALRYRRQCGAKTRKGHPCRLLSEPGKRRCKFHGGMSTGPKTKGARERIAAAQKRRWATWRTKGGNYQS